MFADDVLSCDEAKHEVVETGVEFHRDRGHTCSALAQRRQEEEATQAKDGPRVFCGPASTKRAPNISV